MSEQPKRVAIIGVAGFVGQHLARTMRSAGWEVFGAASPRNSFLLEHLGIAAPSGQRFPVVINLAYPTTVIPLGRKKDNAGIIDQIRSLVAPGGLVVHASTLAVFGIRLDRPQVCGPLAWRPDHDYVESKVWMENQLRHSMAADHQLEIVRFGNVWGPSSGHWLAGMAVRLRSGLPCLVNGGLYSNVTDVGNVVDYLRYLAEAGGQAGAGRGVGFHHLSEFSKAPWETFLTPVAHRLGIPIRRVDPPAEATLRSFVFGRLAAESFRFANQRKVAGSLIRLALNTLPENLVTRLRREKRAGATVVTIEEPALADVLGCRTEFVPVTVPDWTPPVTLERSISEAIRWLEEAGFVGALP